MNRFLKDIDEFHAKFGIHYPDPPRLLPGDPPRPDVLDELESALLELRRHGRSRDSLVSFRVAFMLEELVEYARAVKAGDLAKALDALVDLDYVLKGTVHLHGFCYPYNGETAVFEEAWRRVHDANMAKVKGTGATSERSVTFDVVKPPGWTAPVLDDLVEPTGDDASVMNEIYSNRQRDGVR